MAKEFDVFISYSNKNSTEAVELCNNLEMNEIRCWMAPRDIPPGAVFPEAIAEAIQNCKSVLLLLTPDSNVSDQVVNEMTLASNHHKTVVPFSIGTFTISDSLSYFLGKFQRVTAGEPWSDSIPGLIASYRSEFKIQTPGNVDPATVTDKFNQHLTIHLIEIVHSGEAGFQKLIDWIKITPDWFTYPKVFRYAKEIIITSFIGAIGKELEKLMAIGEEPFSMVKQQKYLAQCLRIPMITLDLTIFATLSKLWEIRKEGKIVLNNAEIKTITAKFDSPVALTYTQQFDLLSTLTGIFVNPVNGYGLPFEGLDKLFSDAGAKKELYAVAIEMQRLEKENANLNNCALAEQCLTTFLQRFSFLCKYQMATVKLIGYRKIRFDAPSYIHRLVPHIAKTESEKVDFASSPVNSDSVILYKGDQYRENLSLFPFIIDYNALIFEEHSRICFYQGTTIVDNQLEFVFLDDNTSVFLKSSGITGKSGLNEIFLQKEKIREYNIECVVNRFAEARRVILGEPDFGNI